MIKNKFFYLVLILVAFGILLINSCTVQESTTKKPADTQVSTTQETAPAQPVTPTTPSATTKPIAELTSLKCDGNTYNIAIKPENVLVGIILKEASGKQKIADLKSEGLIEEFVEIAKNNETSELMLSGTLFGGGKLYPGWSMLIADIKEDSEHEVQQRVRPIINEGGAIVAIGELVRNYEDKEIISKLKCKVTTVPTTGRITVYSNIPEAKFTITGPATYSGSGLCWTKFDAPVGKYSINWHDVPGYNLSGWSLLGTLSGGMHNIASGHYKPNTPKDTSALVIVTNLPEAKFTITGPTTYSGSGTCWAQANVLRGRYEVVFEDVPGYEIVPPSSRIVDLSEYAGTKLDIVRAEYI